MNRKTIKSFVYRCWDAGVPANAAWQSAQAAFPHKVCSWSYVSGLYRRYAEGEAIAKAFADIVSAQRK